MSSHRHGPSPEDHAAAPPAADAASRRVRDAYLNEGMALLGEGVAAALIERIGVDAGMPAGPLEMLDELSLQAADEALHRELAELERAALRDAPDQAHDDGPGRGDPPHGREHAPDQEHGRGHAHDHSHDHAHDHGHGQDRDGHRHGHGHGHDHDRDAPGHDGQGHDHSHARGHAARPHRHAHRVKSQRMPESAVYVLEKMAHGFRRTGRAQGAGFYDYLPGEPKSLWPGLSTFARGSTEVGPDDIRDRLLYAQAIEAARCLDERLSRSPRDGDTASARDDGPPIWTDGAARLVEQVGVTRFVERADALAARYGERFRPPASLREQAARGEPRR